MSTMLKDWHIVSVYQENTMIGKILWGIIVEDATQRFAAGDYVCTSKIVSISAQTQLIKTFQGNTYKLVGEGATAEVQLVELELLRSGFSPQDVSAIRSSKSRMSD